jgi:hypothetical protein
MRDSINLRRHRNACKYYREDWRVPDVLYRCYCLLDMPPVTSEDQEKCLKAKDGCWRFKEAKDAARASAVAAAGTS